MAPGRRKSGYRPRPPSRRMLHRIVLLPLLVLALGPTRDAGSGAGPGSDSPAEGEQTAIVQGSVRVADVDAAPPPMLSPYARRRYSPPATPSSGSTPEDVVVYLVRADPPEAEPGESAVIVQRDQTVIPRVTAIRTGTRIDFPNEDDIFHNLFSLSDPHPFNLGRYPPGESRSETFERPGVVRMFCDIHSDMVGVILVLDTPYFAKPDATGAYRIPDVAAGRYTAVAWHESAPPDSVEVVVPATGTVQADFQLGM